MPSSFGVPRTSPVKPRDSSLAISASAYRRTGESVGRPATSFGTRLRIWYEKWGVAEATSWRMSSTVTSRSLRRRSGCSASAMVELLVSGIDGLDLKQSIYAGLDGGGQ